MNEIVQRFPQNPLLRPGDVLPSREDMVVECLLNPGVFRYENRIGLLLRVAERPHQENGWVSLPLLDPSEPGGIRILRVRKDDPDLQSTDPRILHYKGRGYLTTLSHLRLAWSGDGTNFEVDRVPTLIGSGSHESFGIEDCRVEFIEGRYWLTYSAVSEFGVGVGLISTGDWKSFDRHGIIFPPHNKDCALFPEKIGGRYWSFHRPSGLEVGGNFIWISSSPDLKHWGNHRCIVTTRPSLWDSQRVGAGAAPIKTSRGWLAIYHGADRQSRYCLGALLLDLENPARVIARAESPLMEPVNDYECQGFFGNVVFTNGHIVDGDQLTIYYGASDTVICAVRVSIAAILDSL